MCPAQPFENRLAAKAQPGGFHVQGCHRVYIMSYCSHARIRDPDQTDLPLVLVAVVAAQDGQARTVPSVPNAPVTRKEEDMARKNEAPDYELFRHRGGHPPGWAALFTESLVAGIPQRIPIEESKATSGIPQHRYGNVIRVAAKRQNFTVTVRTVDGELWACRLRDEDVDGE